MLKVSGRLIENYDDQSDIARDLNSIIEKLALKDERIWGEGAEAEARIRLNWVDLPKSSIPLIPQLNELKTWVKSRGLTNLILCGMGGSSLAPEVIAKTYGKSLWVLDSTDPEHLKFVLSKGLQKTAIIIGSKSGSTIETASHKLFFESELKKIGLNPTDHLIIITDPNSPLDLKAREENYQVINADPNVGGRFSALSAFGLVPAALMDLDIASFLNEADIACSNFGQNNSIVVKVAAQLISQTKQIIGFCDHESKVPGLADWIEQLIAESTGKDGVGRLPVVLESAGSEISANAPVVSFKSGSGDLVVEGSLSEQFIFWEWVTALMCRALNVDPFNQPNVTEAKDRTGALLNKWAGIPRFENISYQDDDLIILNVPRVDSIEEALINFLAPSSGYISIMAYLNRMSDSKIIPLRELLADKSKRATTFGWGPRFLHSTGQFHKGGQQNGAFIQITAESEVDFEIPTRKYSFHSLILAQALGDAEALNSRKLPLISFHLKNRKVGIDKIISAVKNI